MRSSAFFPSHSLFFFCSLSCVSLSQQHPLHFCFSTSFSPLHSFLSCLALTAFESVIERCHHHHPPTPTHTRINSQKTMKKNRLTVCILYISPMSHCAFSKSFFFLKAERTLHFWTVTLKFYTEKPVHQHFSLSRNWLYSGVIPLPFDTSRFTFTGHGTAVHYIEPCAAQESILSRPALLNTLSLQSNGQLLVFPSHS